MSKKSNQKGFTIIELLIATTVFSVILMIVSSGIIQIGRFYYKNITSARTQEAARNIIEEVSRTAQFSQSSVQASPDSEPDKAICIGPNRYSYVIDRQVGTDTGDVPAALVADINNSVCAGQNLSSGATINGSDLLSANMRLLNFEVSEDTSTDTVKVKVKVAYGDNDLLTHCEPSGNSCSSNPVDIANSTCRTGIAGSSFCSVSELETSIKRR